jgi:hypothetical protein
VQLGAYYGINGAFISLRSSDSLGCTQADDMKVQEHHSIVLFYYITCCIIAQHTVCVDTSHRVVAVQATTGDAVTSHRSPSPAHCILSRPIHENTLPAGCCSSSADSGRRPCCGRGYHDEKSTGRPMTQRVSINELNRSSAAVIDRRLGRNPGSNSTSSNCSA